VETTTQTASSNACGAAMACAMKTIPRTPGSTLDGFLNEEEFARDIGKSVRTVRRYDIDWTKIGRTKFLSPAARARWLASRERPTRPRGRRRRT
jgi:hypothetical protein